MSPFYYSEFYTIHVYFISDSLLNLLHATPYVPGINVQIQCYLRFPLFNSYLTQLAPSGLFALPYSGIADKEVLKQVCNLWNALLTIGLICKRYLIRGMK